MAFLLLAGVACSSPQLPASSTNPTATQSIDAHALGVSALETTINAGTSRVTVVASFGGQSSPAGITAAGVFDYRVGTGLLTFTAKSLPSPGYDVRFVKGIAYMHVPRPYSLLPGIKPWIKLDLHRRKTRPGYFGTLGSVSAQHPGDALSFLRGAKTAELIGAETVGADATTRYKITVDLKRAHDSAPAGGYSRLLGAITDSASSELVIDLWVDSKGRARKVLYSLDLASLDPAAAATVLTMAVEYFDFGVPVNVEPPPASQVGV